MAGVLSKIRVLDLTRYLAGPSATQMLADLGAEVIKVEHPNGGDFIRTYGPIPDKQGNPTRESPFFLGINRNKKSVTIDISTREGQDLVRRLAAKCDVVIENYKVDTLQRYGLSYEDIKAIKSDVIYCSITGYGQNGPYRERAGFDPIIQAQGGLMSINGVPEGQPGAGPMKDAISLADVLAGKDACIAILGALNHRHSTGRGQYIDIALLNSLIAAMTAEYMRYLAAGEVLKPVGNVSRYVVPGQTFRCKDGNISLTLAGEGQFPKLMKIMGTPELASDERFATNSARVRNKKVLVPLLEAIFLTRTVNEWVEEIASAAIPCGPVNNVKQVFEDAQVQNQGMRVEIDHSVLGKISVIGNPIKYSDTPIEYRSAPPTLGQHTEEVLHELANIDGEQFGQLIRKGIV